MKVVDFIDFYEVDDIIDKLKDKTLLCLDGIDEYRTNKNNKPETLRMFAKKLVNLDKKIDIKVVISCIELNWYGDDNKTSLKRYLSKDIEQ